MSFAETEKTSKENFASTQWVGRMNKKAAKYEFVNIEFRTGKKVPVSRDALFECDWEAMVEDPVEVSKYDEEIGDKRSQFEASRRTMGDDESISSGKKTSKKVQQDDEEREWQKVLATIPKPKRMLQRQLNPTAYKHDLERVDRAIMEYQKANRELVKEMMESLDLILTTLVEQAPGYEDIMSKKSEKAGNALALRNLIISIADGVDVNSGYSVIQSFVGMRQKENTEDGFTRVRQKFLETANQLQKIPPKDLVDMLFNVVFINMVDLSNFPTVRDELGKSSKWPSYEDLGNQIARLWKFSRQFPEQREDVKANAVKNSSNEVEFNGECHNCGKAGHRRTECRKPKHRCGNCNNFGHLERFCYRSGKAEKHAEDEEENSYVSKKKSYAKRREDNGRLRKPSVAKRSAAKSDGKRKLRVRAAESRRDDEDYYSSDDDNYSSSDADEDSQDDEDLDSRVIKISRIEEDVATRSATLVAAAVSTARECEALFVVDSGCIGAAHVCNDASILADVRKARIRVQGYDGHESLITEVGEVKGIGRCALIPDAPNNLVNLLRLLDDIGGRYEGNQDSMTIYRSDGSTWVRAVKRQGFLSFRLKDIHRQPTTRNKQRIVQSNAVVMPQPHRIAAMSAQDRARAKEAYKLCDLLGHPGIAKVKKTLEGPNLTSHLTPYDVENAVLLYGPCPACVEGKMRAPPARATVTRGEAYVGEKIYADLLMYEEGTVAIGGYTGELFTKDGKSGFLCVVGLKSKHSIEVVQAFKATAAMYYANHHVFEHVVFDDERTFNSCRLELNSAGIKCSATPAGLHNRVVESSIQTYKRSDHAVLAALSYVPPVSLVLERHKHIIDMHNSVCNARSGGLTAFELFYHRKPFIPVFTWGQPGLFFHTKGKGKDGVPTTSEYGIFVGYKDFNPRNILAYIPATGRVTSKRKMQALQYLPTEWNYPTRTSTSTFAQLSNPQSLLNTPPSSQPTVPQFDEDTSSDEDDDLLAVPAHYQPPAILSQQSTSKKPATSIIHPAGSTNSFPSSQPPPLTTPSPFQSLMSSDPPPLPTIALSNPPAQLVLQQPPPVQSVLPASSKTVTQRSGNQVDPISPREGGHTRVSFALPPQEGERDSTEVPTSNSHLGLVEEPKQRPTTSRKGQQVVANKSKKVGQPESPSPLVTEDDVSSRGRKRSTSYKDYAARQDLLAQVMQQFMTEEEGAITANLSFTSEYNNSDPALRKLTRDALEKELMNFVTHPCFRGRSKKSISKENLWKNVIPGHPVVDDQFHADGTFKQRKVRLVIGGDRQNKATIGETNSPTVNPISLLVLLAGISGVLAKNLKEANTGYVLSGYDFVAAFLTTEMKDHNKKKIILHIRDRRVVRKLVQLIPELQQFVNEDGSIYLDVLRWVYGLSESSRAFYLRIDAILRKIGFRPTPEDPCLYVKNTIDGIHYLSLHVDDVLSVAPSLRQRDKLRTELEREFQLKVQEESKINYLGLVIQVDYQRKSIKVSQNGYVEEILRKFFDNKRRATSAKTPAPGDLFEEEREDGDASLPCDQRQYLSVIMSLMFLARMTRPDILLPVTYLATKSSSPTEVHLRKAFRILKYIHGTKTLGLVFQGGTNVGLKVYADASHLTHNDGKGHTGILITLGGTVVMSRSVKQKSAARSSTEAELIALEEATTYVKWIRDLLQTLALPTVNSLASKATVVYQDNKSAIHLAVSPGKFSRTKHMLGKLAYIRDRISQGDIALVYKPTTEMLADLLTKPLSEKAIKRLCFRMGVIDTNAK